MIFVEGEKLVVAVRVPEKGAQISSPKGKTGPSAACATIRDVTDLLHGGPLRCVSCRQALQRIPLWGSMVDRRFGDIGDSQNRSLGLHNSTISGDLES